MKKTSWFAIFVAVLVAGTYYVEFYQANKEEQQKTEEAKIVSFAADHIHQIEVENKSGKVLLKRDPNGWRMEEPVKDWADSQYVDDFVSGLTEEKALEVAAEGENINWPLYSLDKDFSKVTFTNQEGASITVSASAKMNFEGNGFLRRNQENKVLVSSSQWAMRTQKAPLEFRDKRLFRGKIGSVEGIGIKSQKDEFELTNKEARWVNEKQASIKLDQNKVREILTSLNEIKAQEFLPALPKGSTSKTKINLKLKDKSWSADILQGTDRAYYAVVTEPAFVLKLDPGQVDKFRDMTFISLRDRKEPFDFQNLIVKKIELQTKLKKVTLVKEKDQWQLEGDSSKKVDQNAVRSFITFLSDSAVSEYLEKSEQAGFKSADNRITLKDDTQKVLYELTWGPELKKKALVGEKTLILAKSSLFPDIFGLDQSVIDSWGLMNLVPADQNKVKDKGSNSENSH
jgi:hypothetical protein